jgi:protocatechuate 3,4-dioxygenase beta subunit
MDDSRDYPGANLLGRVVNTSSKYAPAAEIILVSDQGTGEQRIRTDEHGLFRVNLATGSYQVYMQNERGRQFHSTLRVRPQESQQITLVSR